MCRRFIDRIYCAYCGLLLDQKFDTEYCNNEGVLCQNPADYAIRLWSVCGVCRERRRGRRRRIYTG
jgi:hypothetical protein